MKTPFTYILTVLALAALTTLSNCSKGPSCPESKTTTEDLTSSALNKVPYIGYDTLYFLNKQGDTCIVRGTGKKFSYITETVTTPPDCPDNYKRTQNYEIIFLPIQGELSFKLVHNYNIFIEVDGFKYRFELFDETIGVGRGDIDSLNVNNYTYYDIDSARLRLNTVMVDDPNSRCLFNKTSGIIIMSDKVNNFTILNH